MPASIVAFGFAAGLAVAVLLCLDCIRLQRRRVAALETAVAVRNERINLLLERLDIERTRAEQAPIQPGPFAAQPPVSVATQSRGLAGRFPLFYLN